MNNNYNTHFYSLEEAKRILETTKEFEDGEQIYYFIGALRYLYDELNKQKEVIDKIKEYLEEDDWTSVNGVIAVKLIKERLNKLLEEIE